MATKQRRSSKQTGGTFLGVVLGLIVGLAIAVVVALYITRSPTPFVSHSSNPASDAAAQTPSTGDPNRSLAGQTPGRPATGSQSAPPNTAPGQPSNPSTGLLDEPQIMEVPGSNKSGAAQDVVPPAPADSDDLTTPPTRDNPPPRETPRARDTNRPHPGATPPAQPAQPASRAQATPQPSRPATPPQTPATPSTPPAAPHAGDANTGYYLQAGAYRTDTDAQQQRGNLAMQGFSAHVTKGESGSVTYYRVRLGPFSSLDELNKVRRPLSNAGVDTVVIRFTKQ